MTVLHTLKEERSQAKKVHIYHVLCLTLYMACLHSGNLASALHALKGPLLTSDALRRSRHRTTEWMRQEKPKS